MDVAIFLFLTSEFWLLLSRIRSNEDGSDELLVHLIVMGCVGSRLSPEAGDVIVKALTVASSTPIATITNENRILLFE